MAMGHVRKKPEFLNNKLLAIREFLNISQVEMASKLQSEIRDNSARDYPIQPARTSDYENAQREPNLLVLMAYARLGKLHLESLVDDTVSVEALRSRLGNEVNYAQRPKKHKSINHRESARATALLHRITRVPIDFDIQSVVAPQEPHLVCRYCKTPICASVCRSCRTPLYTADGSACYLHANNGVAACEAPQVEGLPNRATPYDDDTTYVAYRAELIRDMTSNMYSYSQMLHSPGELLQTLLVDARHFAHAHGLAFDEHDHRSYEIYLQNQSHSSHKILQSSDASPTHERMRIDARNSGEPVK